MRDGEAFGRSLGHEGGTLKHRISALIRKACWLPLCSLLCKITTRRQQSTIQEVGSYQTLGLLAPWSWTSWPPELGEINFCCSNQPIYGVILLWQLNCWLRHLGPHYCLFPSEFYSEFSTYFPMHSLYILSLHITIQIQWAPFIWKFIYSGFLHLQWPCLLWPLTHFQVWLMGKHFPTLLRH